MSVMYNSPEHRADFSKRVEREPVYCRYLFDELTVRLLALKYAYYIKNDNLISDIGYDAIEKEWCMMGHVLGLLTYDDVSPCLDFDMRHPMATKSIKLYESLKRR
jgi:hypothetical protein